MNSTGGQLRGSAHCQARYPPLPLKWGLRKVIMERESVRMGILMLGKEIVACVVV